MPDAEIHAWTDLALTRDADGLASEIDHVFFSSSARKTFADVHEKAAFRERWLGRYLVHYPAFALVACDGDRRVIGYVIGSPSDPAGDPLFADLGFFTDFAGLTPHFPAQLHVNLLPEWRGQGVGARLVDRFGALAREAGAPGMHVVTGRGMRNVGFYLANGFIERGATTVEGRELVFLGRDLSATP